MVTTKRVDVPDGPGERVGVLGEPGKRPMRIQACDKMFNRCL